MGAFLQSKNRLFSSTRISYKGFDFKDGSLLYKKNASQVGRWSYCCHNQLNLTFKNSPPYFLLVKQLTDFDNRKDLGTLYVAVNVTFFEKFLEDLRGKENTTMCHG